MFSDLVRQPLLQVEILPPTCQDGQVDHKGERLTVEHQGKCLEVLCNIQNPGKSGVLTFSFLGSLEVPVSHAQHEDRLYLDTLAVPRVGQDDPRVSVGGEEHLEQLAKQLLPEQCDWWVDLEQAEHQDIGARVLGEGQQVCHLHRVPVVCQVEQGLDQVQAPPRGDVFVLEVGLHLEDLGC